MLYEVITGHPGGMATGSQCALPACAGRAHCSVEVENRHGGQKQNRQEDSGTQGIGVKPGADIDASLVTLKGAVIARRLGGQLDNMLV